MNALENDECSDVLNSNQFSLLILEELKCIRKEIEEQFEAQTKQLQCVIINALGKDLDKNLPIHKSEIELESANFEVSQFNDDNQLSEEDLNEQPNYSLVVAIDNSKSDDDPQHLDSMLRSSPSATVENYEAIDDVQQRSNAIEQSFSEHTCSVCNKIFAKKNSLNAHLQIHLNLKKFKCEVCGQGFNMKGNMKKHMVTHTGIRPFQCDVCGKSFTRAFHLKSHKFIHLKKQSAGMAKKSDENKNDCDVCGKICKKKSNLDDHMLSHSSLRKYQCEVCGQGFKTKNTCRKHLLNHSGFRPYECKICQKAFSRSNHLRAHQLTAKHNLKQQLWERDSKDTD